MPKKHRKSMGTVPKDICKIPEQTPHRHEGPDFCQRAISWSDCRTFLSHHIIAAGLTQAGPEFSVSQQQRNVWSIIVTRSGQAEVWIAGTWQTCSTDQALLIPAQSWHHYRSVGTKWDFAWIAFRGDGDGILPPEPTIRPINSQPFVATIDGCISESTHHYNADALAHWVSLMVILSQRCLEVQTAPRLEAVWQAVLAELAHRWTLADLARYAECSIEALRLITQQHLGRSPMAHVTWLRMRQAATHLLAGNDTVQSIAERVGYDNAFAFSVAFKRLMGVAPAVYRGQRHGQFLIPGDPLGRPRSRGGRGVGPARPPT